VYYSALRVCLLWGEITVNWNRLLCVFAACRVILNVQFVGCLEAWSRRQCCFHEDTCKHKERHILYKLALTHSLALKYHYWHIGNYRMTIWMHLCNLRRHGMYWQEAMCVMNVKVWQIRSLIVTGHGNLRQRETVMLCCASLCLWALFRISDKNLV
jgi:hypothetical protein